MNVESLPIGVWPSAHLDYFGFKSLNDERYFLKYLQGVTSQLPMRCKEEYLLWEIGSLHWKDTKGERDWRHPCLC